MQYAGTYSCMPELRFVSWIRQHDAIKFKLPGPGARTEWIIYGVVRALDDMWVTHGASVWANRNRNL